MRKRSIANILKDGGESSTSNQPSTADVNISARTQSKVQCFCSKCNGNLVDPRTKKAHEMKADSTSVEPLPLALPTILPNETPMS